MAVLKAWKQRVKERVDTLEITADKVYVACDEGNDDSAIGCTREEFLEGRMNRLVLDIFGPDVLKAALAYLRQRH
jgi:hypothetical protein